MIDTHTHLYMCDYCADGDSPRAAVDRAVAAGVKLMVLPGCDVATIEPVKRLADERPDAVRMAIGIHPTEMSADWSADVDRVEAELRGPDGHRYVAVGEIGIDLYWDRSRQSDQRAAFDRQMRLAAELGLPVLIHCREGLDDTLSVIEGLGSAVPPAAVFHCFGGSADDVAEIRRRAAAISQICFGIGGIVTFKKAALPDVLPAIGLDHIVLETDAPWLAPVPHRGKRNESAFLPCIAAKIGSVLLPGLPEAEAIAAVDAATTANARRCIPRL